jgi:hypothetical protein
VDEQALDQAALPEHGLAELDAGRHGQPPPSVLLG